MCLPALPALHDAEAPNLWKFAVRVFGDSPDFSLAAPAHKEIAGTAWAKDKFGISQMVRAVRIFLRLPDADHDSWEGDLLPAPDPLCLRARFFGFIALVFPGAIPLPLYHIFPTNWPGSPTICSGVASGYAGDRQTGYSVANTVVYYSQRETQDIPTLSKEDTAELPNTTNSEPRSLKTE